MSIKGCCGSNETSSDVLKESYDISSVFIKTEKIKKLKNHKHVFDILGVRCHMSLYLSLWFTV